MRIKKNFKQKIGERFPFVPDFIHNFHYRFKKDATQFGEAKFLDAMPDNGVYLEIGAFMPHLYSNSWQLERKGWVGLSIDPSPGLPTLWRFFRPKSAFISAAVVKEEDRDNTVVELYSFPRRYAVLNSLVLTESNGQSHAQTVKVRARSLNSLILQTISQFGRLDAILMDVEGYDEDLIHAMKSTSSGSRPTYLIVEDHEGVLKTTICSLGYSLSVIEHPSSLYVRA